MLMQLHYLNNGFDSLSYSIDTSSICNFNRMANGCVRIKMKHMKVLYVCIWFSSWDV